MSAILIQNINFAYPATRRLENPRTVFHNFSLNVEKGEIFGLLGPNGGGKTTLFQLLISNLSPTQGSIKIFDMDFSSQKREFRRRFGVVFQNPSLDKKLTLRENLTHQGHLYGLSGTLLKSKINQMLSQLGLMNRENDFVETLSGGLQRRGEIAKSLLHDPQLLLMDEPSTGLDPGARMDLWDTLVKLKKEGVTILLTTHLMEEGDKCDRVAIINEGQIKALGPPTDLKAKIGGDVINLQTQDPSTLALKIKEKFGSDTKIIDGSVRIERKEGHQFIPQLIESFPGLIQSATVGRPTLEDVFVHETGHRFWIN